MTHMPSGKFYVLLTCFTLYLANVSAQVDKFPGYRKLYPGYANPVLITADSLYWVNEVDPAIEAYQKAKIYLGSRNDTPGLIYSNYMLAELYSNRRIDPVKGSKYIEESFNVNPAYLFKHKKLLADFYLIDATVIASNRPDSSMVLFKRTLELYDSLYGRNSVQSAECYFAMGQCLHHKLKNYDSAFVCFMKSKNIGTPYYSENSIRMVRSYYYIASYYHNKYDYKNTFNYSDEALGRLMKDSVKLRDYIPVMQEFLASVYSELENDSLAIYYYQISIPQYKKLYGNQPELCKMYLNLSENYLKRNDSNLADIYLNKAGSVYKAGGAEDIEARTLLLRDRGTYYVLKNDYVMADRFYREALLLAKNKLEGNQVPLAEIYDKISRMFLGMKSYDSALWYNRLALMKLDTAFTRNDYFENPKINFSRYRVKLYDFLSVKAEIFSHKYYELGNKAEFLQQALDIYTMLDQLSDQMRNSDIPEDSQLILTQIFLKGNESGIRCAQELYSKTGNPVYLNSVLKFMEKSKYMQLFKIAHQSENACEVNVPKVLQLQYDSMNSELSQLDQAIEREKMNKPVDFNKLGVLTSQRLELNDKRSQFVADMNRKYPNYFYVNFDSLITDVSRLRDYARKNDQLLIEYYIGDSNIYCFTVSGSHISTYAIKSDEKLKENLYQFISSVSTGSEPEDVMKDYMKFCSSSFFLYSHLLEPVLQEQNFSESGKLIIVPDGILSQVPFEALIRELPEKFNADYAALHYMIRDYLIRYVYSASLLLNSPQEMVPASKNILAFSYSDQETSSIPGARSGLPGELPGTARELKSIRKVLNRKVKYFTGGNATEQNFKKFAPLYRIIHLSVHGKADLKNPLNSELLFKNGADTLDDGILYEYELYNLDLHHTRLAVLSACETGLGKEFRGEGIFSMARAFVQAGCPSVIMSLWKANDIHTAGIMGNFYEGLGHGEKAAQALRDAKLKFLVSSVGLKAQPVNWAAFVMLGDNRSYYQNRMLYLYWSLPVLILAFVILYFRKKQPR